MIKSSKEYNGFEIVIPESRLVNLLGSVESFVLDSTVQRVALGVLVGFSASYVEKNPLTRFGSGLVGGSCGFVLGRLVDRFFGNPNKEQIVNSSLSLEIPSEVLSTGTPGDLVDDKGAALKDDVDETDLSVWKDILSPTVSPTASPTPKGVEGKNEDLVDEP